MYRITYGTDQLHNELLTSRVFFWSAVQMVKKYGNIKRIEFLLVTGQSTVTLQLWPPMKRESKHVI